MSNPFPLIRLDNIGRTFESPATSTVALSHVGLEIDEGEYVWVSGSSGSGKSTLVNLLACLDRPTSGRYWFAGIDVSTFSEAGLARLRRQTIGLVRQDHYLVDLMTARSNVELPALYAGMRHRDQASRAAQILTSLGLANRMDHIPAELSGGESQRVAVARALMNSPRVILADEPTAALDVRQSDEILSLLKQLAMAGLAVLVASHDSAVARFATRRLTFRDGRLIDDSKVHSKPLATDAQPHPPPPMQHARRDGFEGLRAAGSSLRAFRIKAALLVLVTAAGVASAIVSLGLAHGAYRESLMVMGTLGADRIGIASLSAGRHVSGIDMEDVHTIRLLPNVRDAYARQFGASWVRYGERYVQDVEVYASDNRPEFMWGPWPLAQGQHISRRDSDIRSQVVVIGPTLARALFAPDANPVGERIDIGGVSFTVKGVLARHPIMESHARRNQTFPPRVQIPLETSRDTLLGREVPLHIVAHVVDVGGLEQTAGKIRDLLIRRHGQGAFYLSLDIDMISPYRASVNAHVGVLVGVGVASVAAVAFVNMIFAWVSVRQRRTEIATRMAVGAHRRDLMWQILAETAVTTIAGSAMGAPLALALTPVLGFIADVPPAYEPWFFGAAVAAATLAGSLSGVIPAYRASRLDPVAVFAND
ncbi:MAG: ATP-binding cassette domain-containing protein [Gammaproteobacteria bacterium]|nr:ATP-binding cassette domain-containing protein [Gammaproteobacteria bacterium]